MEPKCIEPSHEAAEIADDEQVMIAAEWALVQELQAWVLPLYTAAVEFSTEELYQRAQDIMFAIDFLLTLS